MKKTLMTILSLVFFSCIINAKILKAGLFYPAPAGGEGNSILNIYKMLKHSNSFLAKAELFSDIKNINEFDVAVFSCVKKMGKQPANAKELIRDYVRDGGGVILLHDSVGNYHALSPSLFPSVFNAVGTWEKNGHFVPAKGHEAHPVMQGVKAFVPVLKNEYVPMRASTTAKVLMFDARGAAVVVVGKYGKGRVAGIASLPGHGGIFNNKNENLLLKNCIFWTAHMQVPSENEISKTELLLELLKLQKKVAVLMEDNKKLKREIKYNYSSTNNKFNFILKTIDENKKTNR